MKTAGLFLRRQYEPLTVGAKLICLSPDSPLTQFYNTDKKVYTPDRGVTGEELVIAPVVSASASDGSWNGLLGNAYLGDPTFYMDGSAITIDDVNYVLVADSTYRWALEIHKNFPIGERHTIWMEAEMNDYRTGQNIPIRTDTITLYTGAFASDGYLLSFSGSKNVVYDPLKDTKLAAEYLTAHGTTTADPEDGTGYEHTQTITLKKGTETVTSGYTLKAFLQKNGTSTQLTSGQGLLKSLTTTSITLDMRLADGENVTIAAYISGKEIARATVCTITRLRKVYNLTMMNEEDIYPNAVTHRDDICVNYEGAVLPTAENVIEMEWKTNTLYASDVTVGYGAKVEYPLVKTAVGNTSDDGWIEQYVEHNHKSAYALAVDESNNYLMDESGNYLIIN